VLLQDQTAGVVFADVDEHLTIDPDSVARLITPKTSAILATHTYGKAADVVALRKLADQHGVALIENAVHMNGNCAVRGRSIGAWGDAAVLSFNVDKPLGAILGGALLTNRDDIWAAVNAHALGAPNTKEMRERIRTTFTAYRFKPLALRLLGRRHRAAVDGVQEIEHFAIDTYNRYTPRQIHPRQARVALACLRREAGASEVRENNASRLRQRLRGDARFALPVSTEDRPHTYTYYPLILREGSRMDLGSHLAAAGIETKWRLAPLHTQAGFTEARCDELSRSESLWQQHLLVPAGTSTSMAQMDRLADALLSWR
jgi:dTDP-4-amino-4,6-dideoxygalactose transaminase